MSEFYATLSWHGVGPGEPVEIKTILIKMSREAGNVGGRCLIY